MARRFKENKYITNTILFLMVAGIIGRLIPYVLFILGLSDITTTDYP